MKERQIRERAANKCDTKINKRNALSWHASSKCLFNESVKCVFGGERVRARGRTKF